MRIVIATPLYPPQIGGPATYARVLFERLPAMGIEVEVLNFGDVKHLPRLIRHYVFYRRLLTLAKRADLILALDPVSVGLPAYFVSRREHKPLIVKIVGDYAWEQGKQRYGIRASLDEFVEMDRVHLGVRVLRWIQKTVALHAARVIVPSGYLKNIIAAWGIPREKIEVIYNAVPFEPAGTLPPSVTALPHPRIVTAGRLVPWKRIDGIIDAVALLRSGGMPASLIVIGDGPERKTLMEHANEKLHNQYVFTGILSHRDLLRTITTSEVFALNSEYEGLSHVLIEALALGTPTVATPAGGNPEIIHDGENGILVPSGDTVALAEALNHFLADDDERSLFAERARASAQRFSTESMLTATVDLFLRFIAS